MTQPQVGASFDPETFAEGGGVPSQKNLKITKVTCDYYDYNGKAPKTFAAGLTLVEDDGTEYNQWYSIGNPTAWMPSEDKKRAIPVVAGTLVSKSCNLSILITAVVNAGFPRELLGPDLSVLEGLYAYWDAIPGLDRSNMPNRVEGEERKPNPVLVPTKILALPGQQPQVQIATATPPPMATTMPAPQPAPAPSPSPTPPVETPPGAPPMTAAPVTNGVDTAAAAKIMASFQKGWVANGGVLTLPQLFPLVQQDYPTEGMGLVPQVQFVLVQQGYEVGPQPEQVISIKA